MTTRRMTPVVASLWCCVFALLVGCQAQGSKRSDAVTSEQVPRSPESADIETSRTLPVGPVSFEQFVAFAAGRTLAVSGGGASGSSWTKDVYEEPVLEDGAVVLPGVSHNTNGRNYRVVLREDGDHILWDYPGSAWDGSSSVYVREDGVIELKSDSKDYAARFKGSEIRDGKLVATH